MTRTRMLLCWLYGLIALAALVATWSQNIAFMSGPQANGFIDFWAATKVNFVTKSITVDLGFFLMAAAIFMVGEARRLKMRFVWLYLIFGFFIAISVAFPVFMLMRERAMARAGEPDAGLMVTDVATLVVTAGVMLWLVWFVLR